MWLFAPLWSPAPGVSLSLLFTAACVWVTVLLLLKLALLPALLGEFRATPPGPRIPCLAVCAHPAYYY